ncbi:DNA gyrase inhibitor YacG [Phenylobacterium sp.]|jgi:hypothetical protein|uniref:DNA gyrase inhibitor YacG n=1 Tax=Phenylobacterium sp. TaxID=1871053 RepID=UPI002F40601B
MSEVRCPICGQSTKSEFRPFCSARCADVDLHRWLSNSYAVPDDPEGEFPEETRAETPARTDEDG